MTEQTGDPSGARPPGSGSIPPSIESGRDVADEDFLFHLYRGSELLQDERVHEAKEELEHALTYQPLDARGQDLLGVVYFRLGLYARAIQIYETLRNQNPKEPSVRLNLALCYLKTHRAGHAREELEALVKAHPDHKKAWGYLGVAYERTGDPLKAREAFERSGHPHLANRMVERATLPPRPTAPPSHWPATASVTPQGETRQTLGAAFAELDPGDVAFRTGELRATAPPASKANTQLFGLLGEVSKRIQSERAMPPLPKLLAPNGIDGLGEALVPERARENAEARSLRAPPQVRDIPTVEEAIARTSLPFPESPGVVLVDATCALVTTSNERRFAVRLEAMRSYVGEVASSVLLRRLEGKASGEPLGGVGAPMVEVSGPGQLVLGARPASSIVAFRLQAPGLAFVREQHLLGFEMVLSHENSRISMGDREQSHVVQLQGTGAVLLELVGKLAAIPITSMRTATVRRDAILGWVGGLVPRAVPPSEAPAGQRGLVTFAGDGTVLTLTM